MRRIIEIAAFVVAAGLPAHAQSKTHFRTVCTAGNGRAICAPLFPPKPRIDAPQRKLQAPEEPYSGSINLSELGIDPHSPKLSGAPPIQDQAATTVEVLLPDAGSPGAFSDVLSAVKRHELMQAQGGRVIGTAEPQQSERAPSADAQGLMDSLRSDLAKTNDFAPGVSPDITVDKSTPARNAAELKGQLILFWQDMRDEYCKKNPGAKYVGLDSNPGHCQDPRAGREKRAADEALNLMEYLARDLARISLQEQDHARDLHCAGPCPPNAPLRLTALSSSDPTTERIIQADRNKWFEMRQVYCRYYHGAEYVDLEFRRQTCP